jgi:hypothetical protein
MNDLVKDVNGKVCNAKIMYNMGVIVGLFVIAAKAIMADGPDYSGLAVLFAGITTPLGAVYYGRNKTKADSHV